MVHVLFDKYICWSHFVFVLLLLLLLQFYIQYLHWAPTNFLLAQLQGISIRFDIRLMKFDVSFPMFGMFSFTGTDMLLWSIYRKQIISPGCIKNQNSLVPNSIRLCLRVCVSGCIQIQSTRQFFFNFV